MAARKQADGCGDGERRPARRRSRTIPQTDPIEPSAGQNQEPEVYVLSAGDQTIIEAAIQLLKKLVNAPFTQRAELFSVAKALQVLAALPIPAALDVPLEIRLSGPRRWFGEHEIWHWLSVNIDEQSIQISSGGHFYRKSSGGDNFTCIEWHARPGSEPDCSVFLDRLQIVDDAKPLPEEVATLDLSEPGFTLQVSDEGNPLLLEPDGEPGDPEPQGDERALTPAEERLAKLADEAEGRRRSECYANPPDTCDLCGCNLEERTFFVDARLREQVTFACLCAGCFFECGQGIGWGEGQLYKRQPGGDWLMVAGFMPKDET